MSCESLARTSKDSLGDVCVVLSGDLLKSGLFSPLFLLLSLELGPLAMCVGGAVGGLGLCE